MRNPREVRNWADRLDDVGKMKFSSIDAWSSTRLLLTGLSTRDLLGIQEGGTDRGHLECCWWPSPKETPGAPTSAVGCCREEQ